MRRDEQISLVVIGLAALVALFVIIPAQIDDSEIATVSPRLVPQLCAGGIFLLALYKFITTLKLAKPGFLVSFKHYRLLGTALAMLVAGTFTMQWLGFWISAGLIVAGAMTLTGERHPIRIVVFAVCLTVVTWFVMNQVGIYIT